MAIEKRKAQRRQVKPKVGLSGTSGSGKTYSSLRMAYGYTGDWSKICLIDTEAGRGELYANTNIRGIEIGEYDYIRLDPPFEPRRYIEAIKLAESDPNIEAIVIDSMSHAWAGTGGMLDMKDAYAKNSKENDFTAWRKITPEHNNLVETVLRSRCVIFATVRSKTEYLVEMVDGKAKPKKVGMAPVFRDGLEYEFTVFMEMSQEHYANASKDNTGIFEGVPYIPTESHGKQLREWMETGKGEPTVPATAQEPEQPKTEQAETEKPKDEITQTTIKALHAIRNEKGLGEDEFKAKLSELFKREVKSLKDLKESEARSFITIYNNAKKKAQAEQRSA